MSKIFVLCLQRVLYIFLRRPSHSPPDLPLTDVPYLSPGAEINLEKTDVGPRDLWPQFSSFSPAVLEAKKIYFREEGHFPTNILFLTNFIGRNCGEYEKRETIFWFDIRRSRENQKMVLGFISELHAA